MERLDGELHLRGGGFRENGCNAVGDLLPRLLQRDAGNGPADEDDQGRAEGRRLGDGAAVVVEGLLPVGLGLAGEEAAPAEGNDFETRTPDAGSGGGDRHVVPPIEGLPPNGDPLRRPAPEKFSTHCSSVHAFVVIVWIARRLRSLISEALMTYLEKKVR